MYDGGQTPIGCSRPSSSQMSSGRPNGRRSSVTSAGASCSRVTTRPCGASSRNGGTEIDTTGDGFLATFDGPARAIRCACAARDAVRDLGLEIRAGLHTGEYEIFGSTIAGLTVHTGARVAALAGSGEVLVSSTVKDLVAGAGIELEDRGEHELKGVPGTWRIYAVRSALE